MEEMQDNGKDAVKKAKFYKLSLRVLFGVFIIFTLIFFTLPVFGYRYENVYQLVYREHYLDGVDSRWDDFYLILSIFRNMFSNVDLVITPCAFMMFLSVAGAMLVIAYFILMFTKYRYSVVGDAALIAMYAAYIIVEIVCIVGVKTEYEMPVGPAPIAMLVVTVPFFAISIFLYIKRKRFFKDNPDPV